MRDGNDEERDREALDGAGRDDEVLRAIHPRVAFVFDFDETLAPNTTDALVRHLGADPEAFDRDGVQPRVAQGWEKRLAEAQALVDLSRGELGPITHQTFAEVGEAVELYDGVVDMFDHVSAAVTATESDLEVEFHLVTAGFVNIPEATVIADRFAGIVGGQWAFDADGAILTPRNTVGHYAKVRHLQAIAKGIESVAADQSDDIGHHVTESDWHVPFEQMVFVGDGDSDLPAFDLLQSRSGAAIAVHQADGDQAWESRTDMRRGRQVSALLPSDFSEGSRLLTALCAAGRRAALWVQLLRTNQ